MTKKQKLFMIFLFIVSLFFCSLLLLSNKKGDVVIISINGKKTLEFPLSVNGIHTIDVSYELNFTQTDKVNTDSMGKYNVLRIEDGYAWIEDADCPDKICVEHKKISKPNETIVCLPHKLVVDIDNNKNKEFDMVVK